MKSSLKCIRQLTVFQAHITACFLLSFIFLQIYGQEVDTSMEAIYAMSFEELLDTKVTIATKSDQRISESPAIVSVITAEDIKNMGARQLEDVLRTIPGFELRKKYNGFYGLEVRGVRETRATCRILLMIDGVPSNEIFYGHSIRYGYFINIDDIERIEIIRGPGSALYGRNAFSGVINIITKKVENNNEINVKGTIGTSGTKNLSGFYGFKMDKFTGSLSFSRIETLDESGDYTTEFGTTIPWDIHHNNYNVNAKIGYGNLLFTWMYFNTLVDLPSINTSARNKLYNYSLSYISELSSKFSLRTKTYAHYESEIQALQQYEPALDVVIPIHVGGNGIITYGDIYPLGLYLTPQFNEYAYGCETEVNWEISSKNNLMFGIQADLHGVGDVILEGNIDENFMPIPGAGEDDQVLYEPGWFENSGHDYYNLAFYIQDIWYPSKRIGITVGSRFDYDNEFGSVFNPRAGLVLEPFKNSNIKVLYGRAYRAPSPSEQFTILGYAFGNKELNPEIINTLELAFNYRFRRMTQSISVFQNKVTNMIYAAARSSIDPSNVYKNIGKNTSSGIEYENKLVLSNNFYTYLNYTYVTSENTDTILGQTIKYNQKDIAPHKINFGVNYHFLDHFNLNLNMFYRSEMDKLEAFDLLSGETSEVKNEIGNYTIFNSTFQIENLIKNINISFSVYNIFDQKYYSQDSEHWYQPPQPGRHIFTSIVYSLND